MARLNGEAFDPWQTNRVEFQKFPRKGIPLQMVALVNQRQGRRLFWAGPVFLLILDLV